MNLQNRFSQWDCSGNLWLVCVYGSSCVLRDNVQFCERFIDSLLIDVENYICMSGGFDDLTQLTAWLVEIVQVFAIETQLPFVFRSVVVAEGQLHVFVEFEVQPQPALN